MTRSSNQDAVHQSLVQPEKSQKIQGFDYLRAIFSIAIIADHAGLFLIASLF